MLWQYIILFILTALVLSTLAFHRNIELIGQILFTFMGGLMWILTGYSLLNINFRWAGSLNVISYTYIPTWEAWTLIFGFGTIGLLMIIIGAVRSPLLLMDKDPEIWGRYDV